MLLVLDIGNSNVVAGLFAGSRLRRRWRFETAEQTSAAAAERGLRRAFRRARLPLAAVEAAALASVVPRLVPRYRLALRRLFKLRALEVGPGLDLGLKVALPRPAEVGADRLVNALAAYATWGGPLLVLDFGTATTVDAVSSRGEYLGGAIAPGVAISVEALFRRTARLPRIKMAPPRRAIGSGTLQAMRSGIYHGTLGATRELCRRLGDELRRREGRAPRIIATGGLSRWLPARQLGLSAVVPDLTLQGLRLAWERNAAAPRPRARRG